MRTGILLAGGLSRRLGEDKALVVIEGTPTIARVAAALSPWVDELLVVHGARTAPDAYRRLLPTARFLSDPGKGPLHALIVGAAAARFARILVAPCDAPFLTPATFGPLDACVQETNVPGAVYEREGVADPLVACYHRDAWLACARAAAAEGVQSLQPVLERLRVTRLSGEGRADLDDIDTPSALARAKSRQAT